MSDRREYWLCHNQQAPGGPYCGNDTFRLVLRDQQVNAYCTRCDMAVVILVQKAKPLDRD